MMEKNFRLIVRLLLGTNVMCLIIIAVQCGEIYLLQEKLSEMSDVVRSLDAKISQLESIQKEAIYGEKLIEGGNRYILGGTVVILSIIALIYFGGIDPGDLGRSLNLLADQSTQDFTTQNKLISDNLNQCLSSIDDH